MPIQFRCPHCNKRLGIARRKAGTHVPCPACQRDVLVPTENGTAKPDPVTPPPAEPPSELCTVVATTQLECATCGTRLKVTLEPQELPAVVARVALGHRRRFKIQCVICGSTLQSRARYREVSAGPTLPVDPPPELPPDLPPIRSSGSWERASYTLEPRQASLEPSPRKGRSAEATEELTAVDDPPLPPPAPAPIAAPAEVASTEPAEEDLLDHQPNWYGWGALALSVAALLLPAGVESPVLTLAACGLSLAAGVAALLYGLWNDRGIRPALASCGIALLTLVVVLWGLLREDTRLLALPAPPAEGLKPIPIDSSEWVDTSKNALRKGGAIVRLTRAVIWWSGPEGPPNKEDRPQGLGKQVPRGLRLQIRVDNARRWSSLDFLSWSRKNSRTGKPLARLTDDEENEYAQLPEDDVQDQEGRLERATILAGQSIEDVLFFQPPAEKVRQLRLELSAAAVGQNGAFRLRIPKARINFLRGQ